jgi:hypothetical protein
LKENVMLRKFVPLLGLLILLTTAERSRAQDEPKSIIEKAIKAHGGEENLAKMNMVSMKTKGNVDIQGIAATFVDETLALMPNKMRSTAVVEVMGMKLTLTHVYDGKKAWVIINEKMVMDVDGDQLKALQDSAYASRVELLFPLVKDQEFELSKLPEQKIKGKAAVGVKVKAKGQRDMELYFDKESGLLIKSSRQSLESAAMKDVLQETYYSDFKEFHGVMHATKAVVDHDGKKFMNVEVTDIKPLDKIDPKEFARPL